MRAHPPFISFATLALALGACSVQPDANTPANNSAALSVAGETKAAGGSTVASNPVGLTVSSTPAAGSTVAAPVSKLVLNFSAPVALGEVLVSGPDGLMPMMLSPAGEQTRFEVPLPALMSGAYTVTWKATQGGTERSGNFAFTVK